MPIILHETEVSPGVFAPLFAEEAEKPAQHKLYTLVIVQPPVGKAEPVIRIVDSALATGEAVQFGGQEYIPFPLKFNGVSANTDGSLDKTSIIVGNVDRHIMGYVERNQGMQRWRIYIRFVYENFLDHGITPDSEAYLEEEYFIDTYTATEQYIQFQLDPIIDLSIQLPRRRFMTDSCFWKYGDPLTCKAPHTQPAKVLDVTLTTPEASVISFTTTPRIAAEILGMQQGVDPSWGGNMYVKFTNIASGATLAAATSGFSSVEAGGVATMQCTLTSILPNGVVGAGTLSIYLVEILAQSCKKTFTDCKNRHNQLNFGGFPGVTSVRRLFI